jgi:hypothetical protein
MVFQINIVQVLTYINNKSRFFYRTNIDYPYSGLWKNQVFSVPMILHYESRLTT